jgi:hypothetical protein
MIFHGRGWGDSWTTVFEAHPKIKENKIRIILANLLKIIYCSLF